MTDLPPDTQSLGKCPNCGQRWLSVTFNWESADWDSNLTSIDATISCTDCDWSLPTKQRLVSPMEGTT